jgi:hypothetical protein
LLRTASSSPAHLVTFDARSKRERLAACQTFVKILRPEVRREGKLSAEIDQGKDQPSNNQIKERSIDD